MATPAPRMIASRLRREWRSPRMVLFYMIAYLVLIAFVVVMIYPFLFMLTTSLKTTKSIFSYPPQWLPDNPTLANYRYVLQEMPFIRYAANTFFVATAVTTIKVVIDAMAGYAFARLSFPGRNVLFVMMISALMLPFAVTLIPTFLIIRDLGLYNTYWALILPPLANPFGIFLLRQSMQTLPRELEDAARIDGCTDFGVFWRIIFPLSLPSLAVLAIVTFTAQWTNFVWPLVATNSENMWVLTVAISVLKGRNVSNWGVIMAISLLAVVPMLIVFIFFQRYFIRGITAGAVKG